MKWYEDLLVWLLIGLIVTALCAWAFLLGKEVVVSDCVNYGSYKNDDIQLFCIVRPPPLIGGGELSYLRPSGKAVVKFKES